MVCESNNPKIPYFNAPIYLENKVGSVCANYMAMADSLDSHWQSGRSAWSDQSSPLYDQASGRYCRYVFQFRRQVLYRRRQAITVGKVGLLYTH